MGSTKVGVACEERQQGDHMTMTVGDNEQRERAVDDKGSNEEGEGGQGDGDGN